MSNPTQPYAHLFEEVVWPSGPTLVKFAAKGEPPEELISNVNAVPVLPGGQFVIIQLDDGNWEIPGGTVEPGEHPLETLKRELQEEAGAMLHSATYIGAWKMISQARKPFRPHLAHPIAYRAVYLCEVSIFSEPQIPIDGGEQVIRVETVNLDGVAQRFMNVGRSDLAELYRFAVDMKGN